MSDDIWRSEAGIPIRNLWMLLVYASELADFRDQCLVDTDDDLELVDILGRLLAKVTERRLRSNLSRGYRRISAVIPRVRGRIDWFATLSNSHLERGRLACRFEELSFDIPRNRLVRCALIVIAGRVRNQHLASNCLRLSDDIGRLGVAASLPSKQDIAGDTIAGHQTEDRLLVNTAQLVFAGVLPSEVSGETRLSKLARDEILLRKIFERAVAGFYRHELHASDGWKVRVQRHQDWPLEPNSSGDVTLLPGMRPDIILRQGNHHRIVLDTKFTNILTRGMSAAEKFKSANIYQIYAYLRSQAERGSLYAKTEGILLYPSVDEEIDEAFHIQGHIIRFVTVNLALKPTEIMKRLYEIPHRHVGASRQQELA
ncbi:conserved protein of unknown function [Bradyrhizobium sp. ORS 285]|uniref:5-methylcytosine-specific restriction endonuclease system specificity protein McrC n=1 Tax=Bradyrhizobium sp. ORS 285 TaxID=115808 RepID=UPI0002406253|nr:5-methylcytosine-specific restriction endonuclease system specificity protein McrC [Bradyrhizobium sp. ORS 285]CCD88395.1 conserved hypothetical protein [Bradyrhizobium sp. ORS 285]SMX56856.1 conserved protein of unknown function [Bradyrhizobium sp. ORS 285]